MPLSSQDTDNGDSDSDGDGLSGGSSNSVVVDEKKYSVEIIGHHMTPEERLKSYGLDFFDYVSPKNYGDTPDDVLARRPYSDTAANAERVKRAAERGQIQVTMRGAVGGFVYKTFSNTVSLMAAAPAARYVATQLGARATTYMGRAIAGGAGGSVFDIVQQAQDNIAHKLSGGSVGHNGFSGKQFAVSTTVGGALPVAGKFIMNSPQYVNKAYNYVKEGLQDYAERGGFEKLGQYVNQRAGFTVVPQPMYVVPPGPSGANSVEAARMSGGLRRPANVLLDDADISRLTREFVEVGGDPSKLRFNSGRQTSYVDELDVFRVRGDVLPLEDALHPRSSMSSRATLAHELGHQAHQGTRVPIGAWNDEFRASYWGAKNAPGLSSAERADLLSDAIMRAREAGAPIKMNKFMRETLYGY
ncbi:hypothetical protein UNDKW_3995 [Undibacterium sp. KW1]|nr:hypothetical protein UNDKW_3995 [Undibacterium sp. KW1]